MPNKLSRRPARPRQKPKAFQVFDFIAVAWLGFDPVDQPF
jgi:hypothetical protein